MPEMGQAEAEYYLRIAEVIYQGALAHEKNGETELATAHLEVVYAIGKELAGAGYTVTR